MAAHKHPNYMAIFWYLAILTVVEVGVVFLPFGKVVNGTLLCALALGKAALVAMYFMHLRFDHAWFSYVFIGPLIIAIGLAISLLWLFGHLGTTGAG